MLQEQIDALRQKEIIIEEDIKNTEQSLKELKAKLAVVKRAKKSLESAQSTLDGEEVDGQTNISE